MKAKDLMIGDWVLIDFTPRNKYYEPGIITGLCSEEAEIVAKNQDGVPFYTDDEKKVLPIPLTAEILEKNGFDMDDYTVHFKEDEHYMLELVFEDDELKWTINCNEYTIMNFEYVHELQHALRLCGIEKEIIL